MRTQDGPFLESPSLWISCLWPAIVYHCCDSSGFGNETKEMLQKFNAAIDRGIHSNSSSAAAI